MRARPVSHSAALHIEDGKRTVSRLLGIAETIPIGQGLEVELDKILTCNDALDKVVRECATSRVKYDDAIVDMNNGVRDLSQVVLTAAEHNRQNPLFVQVFPRGTTPLIRSAEDLRTLNCEMVLERARITGNPDIIAQCDRLQVLLDSVRRTVAEYRSSLIGENAAYSNIQLAKLHWQSALRHAYYAVRDLFPNDRARAEAFFPQSKAKAEEKAEAKAAAEPETKSAETPAVSVRGSLAEST